MILDAKLYIKKENQISLSPELGTCFHFLDRLQVKLIFDRRKYLVAKETRSDRFYANKTENLSNFPLISIFYPCYYQSHQFIKKM